MQTIQLVTVREERSDNAVLAPNSNHHGHVATSFSWS